MLRIALVVAVMASVQFAHAKAVADLDDPAVTFTDSQKDAAVKPFVTRALDCVVREVSAQAGKSDIAALITEAVIRPCVSVTRSMVNAFDRYFGAGHGADFLDNFYIKWLPHMVPAAIKKLSR